MLKKKGGRRELASVAEDTSFLKKDLETWTVHEVGLWLATIDLAQYQDVFFFNEVDGEMLADIDDDDLLALPIDRMAHRKKILRKVQLLKGIAVSDTSSTHGTEDKSDAGSEVESIRSEVSSQIVRIKCTYHDDIRTLAISIHETYEQFKLKILEEFGANKSAKYKDEDGDMITIRNTEDVKRVIELSASRRLKVIIFSSRKKKTASKGKRSTTTRSSEKDKTEKSRKKDSRFVYNSFQLLFLLSSILYPFFLLISTFLFHISTFFFFFSPLFYKISF
jgi:hypothetical protein